jgi:hypothetical protein
MILIGKREHLSLIRNVYTKLNAIMRALHEISVKQGEIMATLDDVKAMEDANSTKIDSVMVIVEGLKRQLADVLSGTIVPPALQAKIDAVFDAALANSTKLDAIIQNP